MKQILMVGAGSVGGFFGAHLAKNNPNISFLLRPKTLEAVKGKGLTIRSAGGSFTIRPPVASDARELPKPDLIVLGVKAYDLDGTSSILESIVTGKRSEQLAVNLPNDGYIDDLPEDIAVEVPGVAYASGVYRVKLGKFPRGIAGLLLNQYAVHDLTAEAILSCSKAAALQALLVDRIVHSVKAAEETLEAMLKIQGRWLGYLH